MGIYSGLCWGRRFFFCQVYGVLEQKVTVFLTIYFPVSSYPVFVFVPNNHGCLSVMQSLHYKTLSKAVLLERQREADQKE